MDPALLPDCRGDVLAQLPQLHGHGWGTLTGGRTNRLWRVGDVTVKLYADDGESPLFPNDAKAEAAALRLLAPQGLGPEILAAGPGWLAYRYVPGHAWRGGDPAGVARLLARVHALPGGAFRRLGSGGAAIAAQSQVIVAGCRGALPPMPPIPEVAPAAPRLIHGDAVPGNILTDGTRLTLIDWQCPAAGDPAEDLAAFLSPAMQWLYRGAVLSPAEEMAFLAAYPDAAVVARFRALQPLFRWRMAAHCLWKAERGVTDYAAAIRLELG